MPLPIHDRDDWRTASRHEHGRVLTGKFAHWCPDWDYMTIDETTPEWEACTCYPSKTFSPGE